MQAFRTEVDVIKSDHKITYENLVMFIGSCFSDNIGEKLAHFKFNALLNPFGVLYNPISVANGLTFLYEKKIFKASDLHLHNGLWHSFYHHSSFSNKDPEICLRDINRSVQKGHDFLKNANHLFITFGTAWVFERLSSGEIVSNCHKIPSSEFKRYPLQVKEIVDLYSTLIARIKTLNPNLHVVFTVSPIRHWKDGPVENQRSKSTLIMAVSELCRLITDVGYFPSYEIMMDDLRDYRFYAEDMLHPNNVAIQYIWGKFTGCYMSAETLKIMQEVERIVKASKHVPFNVSAPSHQKFVKQSLEKISQLAKRFAALDFTQEHNVFASQLL